KLGCIFLSIRALLWTLKVLLPSLQAADLALQLCKTRKPCPEVEGLQFGTVFTDHMLLVKWSRDGGWERPRIQPFGDLSLHPACSALHYALQLFEGLKAYRGEDDRVRLFRPALNMRRMLRSASRLCMPSFDGAELLECIRKLVALDQEWVPRSASGSLYIRPTFVGTEISLGVKKPSSALLFVILSPVGSYFSTGARPVSLWADTTYIRAWRGGTGDYKIGGNYGSSICAQHEAVERGCQQVLWLYGDDQQITEVGTMNVFLYWISEEGEEELATPPLDGIILPGITRQSILELAHDWGDFKVAERCLTMAHLCQALEDGRVKEMFGAGTACVVCPISRVLYQGKDLQIPCEGNFPPLASRFLRELTDIQVGVWHAYTHTRSHKHTHTHAHTHVRTLTRT
uniref:Branched-chain-amino-acid aminotransferase n=1 Tax=Electrophorus electricus TaxID=8005 RepID=A0AAY5EUH4_ELEEL